MDLSKTYISSVDKYIHSRGNGLLFECDGMAVATNAVSLILFTPVMNYDGSCVEASDFTGIEVGVYPKFKDHIWKHIVAPYWDDRPRNYSPMPITLYLEELKKDSSDVHKEYDIPTRTKLYSESITNGTFATEVALNYGGMWLNPELMYDVAKLISSKGKPVDIWIPNNRRQPAVIVGENKYGTHLGFVLGTMKNFKEN